MKTEQLIGLLSCQAGPAPRALAARRLAWAALAGLAASAALAAVGAGLIPVAKFLVSGTWTKLAYGGALAVAAAMLTARLSQPGANPRPACALLGAVLLAMLAVGCGPLALLPTEAWRIALLGGSWQHCSWRLLTLSMPALAAALWAVRGLAPMRPGSAGFAAGVFAGALGACGYALACTEPSLAFVAVWYTLGVLLAGAVGALLGRRWLRW